MQPCYADCPRCLPATLSMPLWPALLPAPVARPSGPCLCPAPLPFSAAALDVCHFKWTFVLSLCNNRKKLNFVFVFVQGSELGRGGAGTVGWRGAHLKNSPNVSRAAECWLLQTVKVAVSRGRGTKAREIYVYIKKEGEREKERERETGSCVISRLPLAPPDWVMRADNVYAANANAFSIFVRLPNIQICLHAVGVSWAIKWQVYRKIYTRLNA